MLVRIKESYLPVILFILTLCAFVVFYFLFFRDYLGERVYPVSDNEADWVNALNDFFYLGILLTFLISFAWLIVSWITNLEPSSILKKWRILLVLSLITGVVLPVVFLLLHNTSSGLFNFYIFIYYFLMIILSYLAVSIISHPECPGWLNFIGK